MESEAAGASLIPGILTRPAAGGAAFSSLGMLIARRQPRSCHGSLAQWAAVVAACVSW